MEIFLDESVRKSIDEYMKNDDPVVLGYESHAYSLFRSICVEWFSKDNYKRILKIKEECCQFSKRKELSYYKMLDDKYNQYFTGKQARFYWFGRLSYTDRRRTETSCMRYFSHDGKWIFDKFIQEKHGSLEDAIVNTETFNELWNQFEGWFEERRQRFMDKMAVDIANIRSISTKKTPQSHGGVANLLKVLTRTMEKQGSYITSIAKVQYAICVQAGIYIPEEFIRDVAVAMDFAEEGVSNGED